MKKFVLFIILQLCMFAKADNTLPYHPMLEDGKVWILHNTISGNSDLPSYKTKIWIDGDTIINDVEAKKLAMEDIGKESPIIYAIVKEVDKQLFFYYDELEKWSPIMDFSCGKGEYTLPASDSGVMDLEPFLVEEEGIIKLYDKEYRYLKMFNQYWIEGIGSPSMTTLTFFPVPTCDDVPIPRLDECYLGDILLFSWDEWQRLSSVNPIMTDALERSIIFDLHGREVSNPLPGSIYIRNGKKFVAK